MAPHPWHGFPPAWSRHGEFDMSDPQDEIAALRSKISSAEASLAAATKGYKKVRQMRGADAHKRSWYFEEQMQKWAKVIERSKAELAKLEASGQVQDE